MTTWRDAYLRQADSDFEVLKLLQQQTAPICQQIHYLQMASEKLAKSFLSGFSGSGRLPSSHEYLVKFIRATKSHPVFSTRMGFRNRSQYSAYADSLLIKADELEKIHPTGTADRPNPEYPWESQGKVYSPLDYAFPSLAFSEPKMIKLLRFLEAALQVGRQQP